ncbi:hypothetical protein [Paraglaciecola arctica]|uniref:hypothetical protein n=1 Tax=Paraglaciecola arctica TaxID=1128911 RepID=UPI001C067A0C|nr:hypothetical protein [Paraglaciecola arctica]MBU3004336.1 hypothetical protein [Paraglaciecola arctica]
MQHTRREFLKNLSYLFTGMLTLSTAAILNPSPNSNLLKIKKQFSQASISHWIVGNLSNSETIALIQSNLEFINTIPLLTFQEVSEQISSDFIADKTIIIQGIYFSIKEVVLLVIVNDPKFSHFFEEL